MYSPNDDVELCGGEMSDPFPSGVVDSALGGAPASTGTRATFELSVGPFAGRALDVVSFVGREAISKLFAFDVLVVANEGEDLLDRALIGLPATFTMQVAGETSRIVQGIIASVQTSGHTIYRGKRAFELRVVPRLWRLKKRITSRIFQDHTVPEIIGLVLDGAGVPHAERLLLSYEKRAYCVQYQESDFAFIARIAAEEGIFWYFEQPVGAAISGAASALGLVETVVFADNSRGYVAIQSGVEVDVSVGLGGVSAFASAGPGVGDSLHLRLRDGALSAKVSGDDVSRFALRQSLRSSSVLLHDYDFQRPQHARRAEGHVDPLDASLSIRASGALEATAASMANATTGAASTVLTDLVTGDLEVYGHRGEYDGPDVDPDRARVHLEQHRARGLVGTGESTCRRMAAGYRFWLDAEDVPALEREYAITLVRHEGHSPELTTRSASGQALQTYSNRFECVPRETSARPRRPKRRIQNVLESGVVVGPASDDIYTDQYGRVKVQFHWDREGKRNEHSSSWIRVVQGWAGASFGLQFVPRIGMEVMVSFLAGDQDCPVVTGCVYNATHPAPFLLPADKTRSGLRTQSSPGGGGSNELSFEDEKTREQIYLHAQRDLDEVVERNHTLSVGGDEVMRVAGLQSLSVGRDQTETVQGNVTRTISKDETTNLVGNRMDVVGGNADVRVAGELNTRVGRERREITGRGDLTLADDYTVRVKGCYTTIVGRNDAKRSYVLRVEGTGQLSSSGVMEIDAEKGLTLRCGKSFIKISADKIELVAPSVSVKGEGGGIVVDDDLKLNVKGDAILKAKSLLVKTEEASMSLKTDVQIDGKKILLNSPDLAKDPVADKSPPPTSIQMKDQSGKPLAYQRFVIAMGDGSEYSGILDGEGKTEMPLDGSGTIRFPDLAKPS